MFRAGAISTTGDLSGVRLERKSERARERKFPSRALLMRVQTRGAFARKQERHSIDCSTHVTRVRIAHMSVETIVIIRLDELSAMSEAPTISADKRGLVMSYLYEFRYCKKCNGDIP